MPTLQPEVLGLTFDGVKILKPVTEPTSFTVEEIRETVAEVMDDYYRDYEELDAGRHRLQAETGKHTAD